MKGPSGLFVPAELVSISQANRPITAPKFAKGIGELFDELGSLSKAGTFDIEGNFEVRDITLTASFSADGKFMGFGIGGAASIAITLGPVKKR